MTWTARTPAPAAAAAVMGIAALALTACGATDDSSAVDPVEVGTRTVAEGDATTPDPADATASSTADDTATGTGTGTGDPTPATGAGATGGPDGTDVAGLPPRPERDRCVDLPEATDGVYTVYEAGTATVTVADGRLTLVGVQAADGWESRVDGEDADEVEVDFRPDGQGEDVLDLEVEVDDGRVEVQVCNDDD